MNKYVLVFIKILILSVLAEPVQARWAEYSDANIEMKFYNTNIIVNADGTFDMTVEMQAKILKEAGREYAAHYTYYYNGDSSKFLLLEAKTFFKGKEYKLSKNLIEDKPLASSQHGFDQQRQVLLAFPKAEIGASIYLKYKLSVTKVPLSQVFSTVFHFGSGEYLKKSTITLHSKIPLHSVINDPDQVLEVSKDVEDNFHAIRIVLKKPIYRDVINEPENSILNKEKLTWVLLSSMQKWDDLSMKLSKDYIDVMNQPLPTLLKEIVSSAAKIEDEETQINQVISNLIDKIQYVSDVRTISGRFIPQSLEKLVANQMGDCKDFSTATAAMLKKLGFKAQVALVLRGIRVVSYDHALPTLSDFNHAILKVTNKDGKVYWLDPTNSVSQVDGIFPDIAGKMSLVLDDKNPVYEMIPNINPAHAQTIIEKEINNIDENTLFDTGKIIFKGEKAINITAAALYRSQKFIQDMLFNILSDSYLEEENKVKMVMPEFTRIVRDVTIDYAYKQINKTFKTNLGEALTLKYNKLNNIIDSTDSQVSDLFIDIPHSFKNHVVLKNVKVDKVEKLNFSIISPWVDVTRICSEHEKGIEIVDNIVIHQSLIPNQALSTSTYQNLKKILRQNLNAALIFN
ncbi:MAG: DUF3857 domain-containing protein [Rickettsiales endosymbiont of Dermacentor nuttalli]